MNKKLFILTLCFTVMLASILFGETEDLFIKGTEGNLVPTTHVQTKLLYNQKPIILESDNRDLLWDQQSTVQGPNAVSCQYDSTGVLECRTCDNFDIPYDANIDSIVWWGYYYNGTPSTPLGWNIEFFEDSGGGLGPKQVPVYFAPINTFNEIDLGGWFRYEASIPPFSATTGVTYYLVPQAVLAFPPQFGVNCDLPPNVGDGNEGYLKSAYFGIPNWTALSAVVGNPLEFGFQIYGSASAVTFWDFEDGWQGWTHTSSQVFPAAWDVQASGIHSPCPDPGDSSMWIDSDASGGGYSDSALSPVVVPPVGMTWLKYGYYNYGGGGSWINELRAGIKYFTGGVGAIVELAYYPAGVVSGPAWDSVDVSAYAASDSIQVYFYYSDLGTWGYYSAFDNVELVVPSAHDVGCFAVTSPVGTVPAGNHDVIGRIRNYGGNAETFDATAKVWDTTGGAWTEIFNQTANFTAFAVGGDSLHNFGTVTFADDSYYYTQIYTALVGDEDTSNDTSFAYSQTAMPLGEIIFELDVETPAGDNQLLGVEFDGTYFYVTGGGGGSDPNKVYVIDLSGTLIWTIDQPGHSTGWGWRDLAWDNVYTGPDKIDTLWASVNTNVDGFIIDLTAGTLTHPISYPGTQSVNRALAWMDDSLWFWTANFGSSVDWFDKFGNSGTASNSYAMYGAAYDTDPVDGGWVWWHSQDDPGTGWLGQISQFNPQTMSFTGLIFGYNPTITVPAVAGGLCFYEGFNDMDVLFALVQGTPDAIIGLFVRSHVGVEEEPVVSSPAAFMLEACKPNPVTNGKTTIAYSTTKTGPVSLKIYDSAGRLVKTLVDRNEDAGVKNVYWDCTDNNHQPVSAGVYFYRLTAQNRTATNKMVVVK